MANGNIINAGGINGLGESLVNMNSKDFKFLKELIKQSYENQTEQSRIEAGLLAIRFQMESYLNANLKTEDIKPAGFFVEKILNTVKINKKQFAEYIEYEYSNFIAVLRGRRKINSELAIKLGQIFKIEPAIWLHIESKNELINTLNHFNGSFNLSDLLKQAS
ncbi:MAG TPA: hypothetical protein PKA00_00260 [Saprospiraceae bacterium]|nr:hypothetical protein [Saprospiraceae bacterium]HMQ81296.1 hypothetical protein [Saprospiraceae bacterium]